MAIWKVKGPHITCKAYQRFLSPALTSPEATAKYSVLMCIDFMSFKLGNTIQSDILFGSSLGEISTFCSGKHFILNDQAHEGPINVIRVTDQLTPGGTINILTGGEDGFVKVWDSSCRMIHKIDMRDQQVLADLKNKRAFGVQSLDIYICDKKNPKRVLAGLRCGEIMEAVVTFGKEERTEEEKVGGTNALIKTAAQRQIMQLQQGFSFDWYPYMSSHASLQVNNNQKKVAIALHPIYSVMASVGDDETLRLWDIAKHSIIVSKNLGTQASCLSFSPDGSFLSVGLVNGVFLLLDCKIEKLNFGTYKEDFHPPSLDIVMTTKEAKTSVIAVKFSFKGDFIAISYDNEQLGDDVQLKEGDKQDTAFVLLYVNRLSTRNPGIR
jgi:WD40 repeat protein